MNPRVTVVIPLKKVNDYLRESLSHLRRQTLHEFDVYVVTDAPEQIETEGFAIRWLASGAVPPNIKRLLAARQSDAEVLAFIDDDAYPVPEWLENGVKHFADSKVVGVGGPAVTPPSDSGPQQASGAVYASALVSAGYAYRYVPEAARRVDDYPSCNLFVRRLPFLESAPQCARYWPGEDTKLCMLLTAHGDRIVYDPGVLVYHHRRRLFWQHFRQVWNYAVHRGFFAKRYPATSRRPAYFVPSVFVLGNAVLVLAALTWPPSRILAVTLATLYAAAVAFEALRGIRRHRANPILVAAGIYLTHITYGFGFLLGLLRPELEH